jgi:hypothetical protein
MKCDTAEIEHWMSFMDEKDENDVVVWLGQAIDEGHEPELIYWARNRTPDNLNDNFRTSYGIARSTVKTEKGWLTAGAFELSFGSRGEALPGNILAGRPPGIDQIRKKLGKGLSFVGKTLYNSFAVADLSGMNLRRAIRTSLYHGEDLLGDYINENRKSIEWDGLYVQSYLLPFYFISPKIVWWTGLLEEIKVTEARITQWAKRRFNCWAGRPRIENISSAANNGVANERGFVWEAGLREATMAAEAGEKVMGNLRYSKRSTLCNVWCLDKPGLKWSCEVPKNSESIETDGDIYWAWLGFCNRNKITDEDLPEVGSKPPV